MKTAPKIGLCRGVRVGLVGFCTAAACADGVTGTDESGHLAFGLDISKILRSGVKDISHSRWAQMPLNDVVIGFLWLGQR